MITRSPETNPIDAFSALCDERDNAERKMQKLIEGARKFAMGYIIANPGTALPELAEALNTVARDLWNADGRINMERLPMPNMVTQADMPCSPPRERT